MQRSDGGWSPQPDVAESTWVTALAALLPEEAIGAAAVETSFGVAGRPDRKRIGWSCANSANDRTEIMRTIPEGWPWFPGAAAWVIPTSFGILAFERALTRRAGTRGCADRVNSAREFLSNACAPTEAGITAPAGPWAATGNPIRKRPASRSRRCRAYRRRPTIERAKDAARRHFAACRTAEGIAWLRMGLRGARGVLTDRSLRPCPARQWTRPCSPFHRAPRNPLLS